MQHKLAIGLARWAVMVLLAACAGAVPATAPATLPVTAPAGDPNAPLDVSAYKPPIRVACLGDGITYGVGASGGWSWPAQLDRMLGDKWVVHIFAHSGATVRRGTKHAIWDLKEYQAALAYQPDVLIILLGTNDARPPLPADKAAFRQFYGELVATFAQLPRPPRIFCATPPYVAREGAGGITDASVREQIPLIRAVAAAHQAGVMDIHAATAGRDEWFDDPINPNTRGASAIAAAAYAVLAGQSWQGAIPRPQILGALTRPATTRAAAPVMDHVSEPGYRECYALMASESELAPEKLAFIRQYYDRSLPDYNAHVAQSEAQLADYEAQRQAYKHATDPEEQKLYLDYRNKSRAAQVELATYKHAMNARLIALLPPENRGRFGAAWVRQIILDRLAAVAAELTPEQQAAVYQICSDAGDAYSALTTTPERSAATQAVYQKVYDQVLTAEQKHRVDRGGT